MRLPDDYEEGGGQTLTPAVLSAIVAVTLFVGIILVTVLLMNNQNSNTAGHSAAKDSATETASQAAKESGYPDTDQLVSGSSLSPDDLDFWDKYPVETKESEAPTESAGPKEVETIEESDPATDGKHTLVKMRDGKEEWVLISPYLPKHEYDFTKLVLQSNLMQYYEDGRRVSYVGADISKYQDYIDFVKLKKAGIQFVMIRVGARGYGTGQLVMDDAFSDNIKRATDAGLQVGVYFSSQAVTVEEAQEEAQMVLEAVGDYKLTYPVAFDMEFAENDTARIETLSRMEKTDIAKAFLDVIAEAGYMTMIYGDKEWLIREIDMSKLTAYDIWLSQIQDVPDYPYRFTMWQYTKSATVDGIAGYADLNISFIDYGEK